MAAKKKNFETQLKRLQAIVDSLENGELALEKSVALYKEGMTLSKECRTQLENARNEIRLFTEEGEAPFEEETTATTTAD